MRFISSMIVFLLPMVALSKEPNMDILKEASIFTLGSGKTELYLFIDPSCHYCTDYYLQLVSHNLDQYAIHVIPYNSGKDKRLTAAYEWILEPHADRKKRMFVAMKDFKSFGKSGLSKEVRPFFVKAKAADVEIGLPGLPSLYDDKGKMIEDHYGALNISMK